MSEVYLVICTFPSSAVAKDIAHTLVSEKLVACANLLPKVESVYRWEDKVCSEEEACALFKTMSGAMGPLKSRLSALHPYDCPEIIALPVTDGLPAYLAWVAQSVV